MAPPLRILHAHSTFAHGGKEARAVRLMNAFGPAATHDIWSAMPDETGALAAVAPGIAVRIASEAPALAGLPHPARLWTLARFLRGYDLVLSYNWGAMDAVMARRLFGAALSLPPLVHHEDGFNQDEVDGRRPSRNRYRRLALPAAAHVVVPSVALEQIGLREWRQRTPRLVRIANGIDTARFAAPPAPGALPGVVRQPGEILVGAIAGLRPVKNLPRLVRAFAAMRRPARLVIAGEGPEREAIRAEAARLNIADRVHLAGFLPDPAAYAGLFDILASASDSEQFPLAIVEAMAAGLPVASTRVGDIAEMVAPDNLPFLVAREDEEGLAAALDKLAGDAALRQQIGGANRARAAALFDEARMIAAYADLYGGAIGRPDAFHDRPA